MKKLNKSKGFTLIELVVVIVILGILAATAAPKFIDLTGDAKKSAMEGVQGSIESAVSIMHAKALVNNAASGSTTIEIDGVHYAITNGYPDSEGDGTGAGNSAANAGGIALLLELDATDFVVTEASPTIIQYAGSQGNACRITYTTSAAANTRPVLDVTELANC